MKTIFEDIVDITMSVSIYFSMYLKDFVGRFLE